MKHSHLPHINNLHYHQFITFRTYDSSDEFVANLQHQNNQEAQLSMDEHLDISSKGAYLNTDALTYFHAQLIKSDKKDYELSAFAIMPNHAHLLLKPLIALPLMMQSIKGPSSKRINELLSLSGSFWARSYYDRAIRSQKHFDVTYQYIKHNPLKLVDSADDKLRFYGVFE